MYTKSTHEKMIEIIRLDVFFLVKIKSSRIDGTIVYLHPWSLAFSPLEINGWFRWSFLFGSLPIFRGELLNFGRGYLYFVDFVTGKM